MPDPDAPTPAIRLSDVQYRHGGPGADGFCLDLRAGFALATQERVACIGPSGSGKTTLLHLCCGILVPDEGIVELDGRPLSALPDRRRRERRAREIGLVFQEFELLEYLSTLDNILLPFHTGLPMPADATDLT